MKSWKRGLAVLILAALAMVMTAPADAEYSSIKSARVKVMSQNL